MQRSHPRHHKTTVSSIWEPGIIQKAIEYALAGAVIGTYNRGVCALWGNGADTRFPLMVAKIKGEKRLYQPLSASLPTRKFVAMLDKTKISQDLHEIFLTADELASRTSSLCFIRAPITEAAAAEIPPALLYRTEDHTPILQNWDAEGNEATHRLIQAMNQAGINYPAVTSMNYSGEPEIVSQEEGLRFARKAGIPLFLTDPRDPGIAKGSYTILALNEEGVFTEREGNIPTSLLQQLLGKPIRETPATRRNTHPQADFPTTLLADVPHPAEGRQAIITFISTTKA